LDRLQITTTELRTAKAYKLIVIARLTCLFKRSKCQNQGQLMENISIILKQ